MASNRLRTAILDLGQRQCTIAEHRERSWASITFAGTRHQLDLVFDGSQAVAAGENLVATLPEHMFDLPGQLVADASVIEVSSTADRMAVTIEILTLDNN